MKRLAGGVILSWGWRRRLVALLAGAVASLALAPVDFQAACFIAFPILVWLLDGAVGTGGRLRQFLPAFTTGWWFGFGYFLAGMWWVGAGFAGGGLAWAIPFAVLGLPALLALFYGFATLLARLLWSDGLGRIAALAFGFGVAEWLRSILTSGFAWNAVGYAAMPVPPLMQAAEVIGVFGVSALAVFVFSAPALLATGRHARAGLALAALLAAAFVGYGYLRLVTLPPADPLLQVRIVQIGDGQARGPFEAAFDSYLRLSGGPGTDAATTPRLILWPQVAVPFVLAERPDLLDALGQAVDEEQVLLVGAMRDESDSSAGTRRLYDSIIAIDGTGEIVDAADKLHLLPFADYLPFARLLAGIEMPFNATEYAPGTRRRLLPVAEGIRALPLIGSEAAIPDIAARQAGDARIIVNPAAYVGYAGTPAPYQHLRQAQLRAVEAGLPLLSATAGGISAAIDSSGRIIDALAPQAHGALDVSLPAPRPKFLNTGHIRARGLTFVTFFGILSLLLSIRGRSN
ncbi:apolipoprotein N-acyltransferase [Chelativorans salis]|uniref:Apolipoprotein N-acyltransferase n=1 Tax=Chelativorans salis TaxID=2978478 RepID=A0ABT2LVQ7_9HYPH|nr:apolipoprotein N-acyltransferase [Chelativorans sp. EGI FJ00035]MCT7378605.1 apolipoprotein N-acyltransferase [Chelativorans sp. EGI FJ00035]